MTKMTTSERKLVEDNIGLVYSSIRQRYGSRYMFDDDTVSVGMFGICKAAQKWNQAVGPFAPFAIKIICNEIDKQYRYDRRKKRRPDLPVLSLDVEDSRLDGDDDSVHYLSESIWDGYNLENEVVNSAIMSSNILDIVKREAPITTRVIIGGERRADIAKEYGVSQQRITQKMNVEKEHVRSLFANYDDYNLYDTYKEVRGCYT